MSRTKSEENETGEIPAIVSKPKKVEAYSAEPVERAYLIVNPHGAMHVVPEDLARVRLGEIGWRLATDAEKAKYKAADGNQRAGRPLAKPFSPAKDLDAALPMGAEITDEE